jgi:hypothetical protein
MNFILNLIVEIVKSKYCRGSQPLDTYYEFDQRHKNLLSTRMRSFTKRVFN